MTCHHCGSGSFRKNGSYRGVQRYICKACGRSFTSRGERFSKAVKAQALADRLARAATQVQAGERDVIEMDEIYTYVQKTTAAPSYGLLIVGDSVALLRITSATKASPAP